MKPAHVRNGVFLTLTGLVVLGELVHAFDSDSGTRPWTSYLIDLPGWIVLPGALILGAWLPLHLVASRRAEDKQQGVPATKRSIPWRAGFAALDTLARLVSMLLRRSR